MKVEQARRRWASYFKLHGCVICEKTNVAYGDLGLCKRCLRRTRARLQSMARLARAAAAAAPSINRLTGKTKVR